MFIFQLIDTAAEVVSWVQDDRQDNTHDQWAIGLPKFRNMGTAAKCPPGKMACTSPSPRPPSPSCATLLTLSFPACPSLSIFLPFTPF